MEVRQEMRRQPSDRHLAGEHQRRAAAMHLTAAPPSEVPGRDHSPRLLLRHFCRRRERVCMSSRRVHLRDPGGRQEYPWHLPVEHAVHHLPLGMIDVRVLEQTEVWVDAAGRVRRVKDPSDDHLENVIAMLRHTALSVLLDYSMAAGLGRFRPKLDLPLPVGGVEAVAARWLRATPLWRSLHAAVALRERHSGASPRVRSAGAVYAIRTEGATYVVDSRRRALLTVPPPGEAEESTPQWEALQALPRVRVGRPLLVGSRRRWRVFRGATWDHQRAEVVVSLRSLRLSVDADVKSIASAARAVTRLHSRPRCEYLETEFRTGKFLAAAGDIRVMWAAIDTTLRSHGIVGPVLLVPAALRSSEATDESIDLLIDCTPAQRDDIEGGLAVVLGYHLPVTSRSDYGPAGRSVLDEHALRLTPGL